jgi:DNA-binding response OmpR family regulator
MANSYVLTNDNVGGARSLPDGETPEPPPREPSAAALRVDLATFEVHARARRIPLTRTEFDVLVYLMRNWHRVVSQQELVRQVIGGAHSSDSSVIRVHIAHLRRKLGPDSAAIRTVRGRGFRFLEPAEDGLSEQER